VNRRIHVHGVMIRLWDSAVRFNVLPVLACARPLENMACPRRCDWLSHVSSVCREDHVCTPCWEWGSDCWDWLCLAHNVCRYVGREDTGGGDFRVSQNEGLKAADGRTLSLRVPLGDINTKIRIKNAWTELVQHFCSHRPRLARGCQVWMERIVCARIAVWGLLGTKPWFCHTKHNLYNR